MIVMLDGSLYEIKLIFNLLLVILQYQACVMVLGNLLYSEIHYQLLCNQVILL